MSRHQFGSRAWAGGVAKSTSEAFKGADYGQAIWPHEKTKSRLDAWLYWAAILFCFAAFVAARFFGG